MRRKYSVSAAVVAVLVASPGVASAATKTVFAGPPPAAAKLIGKALGKKFVKTYNPSVNAFFRKRTTINVGDTVSFVLAGFHNVDLPGSSGKDQPLLEAGAIVSGVKDAAGNPFWFNGKVPNLAINPAAALPSGPAKYDGTTRIVTGFATGSGTPKPTKVVFTKAGTYKFFCDVHPGMIGYIVVKPKGRAVPSAAQDAAAVTKQITSALVAAKRLVTSKIPKQHVDLGLSAANGLELFQMFPTRLTVKAGTDVTFSMSKHSLEVHTATFGPKSVLAQLAAGFSAPVLPPAGVYPSDPTQPIALSPTSHGNGFVNTGALDRDPDTPTIPVSGRIKFTTPGTYHFICLIHPFMQGTVVVK